MKSTIANELGRILTIGFSKGDLLLESIEQETARHGIHSGVVISGIGTLSKTVYHYIITTNDEPADRTVTVNAPVELSSVQGLIVDGKPHLHMAFSDTERAYTGHLEPGCEMLYLGELVILEIKDLKAVRKPNPYGIMLLEEQE